MTTSFIKKLFLTGAVVTTVFTVGATKNNTAEAAVQNATPKAKVSFTFDDGGTSNITKAAPALAQYGFTGTSYVTTGCVGKTTVPNTCAADTDIPYMTWAQVKLLQNTYGWEIGSHSVSHPLMTEITAAKLEQEVANSKKAFQAQGINATSFATPYGDYNQNVLAAIAKYYTNHRGFADTGYNTWPYSNYLLRVQQVQAGVSVDTVKGYINQAAADGTWLILVFHDIQDNPSTNPEDYQFSTADLSTIAAYVKSQNISVTNVSKGLVAADTADNLVKDPAAGSALGNGWTTDGGTAVKVDTTSKGNSPEAARSVKVTAGTKNIHVFTPTVGVNPKSTYVVKGYVNIAAITSGEVGFYIDEYDANGNWVSGQYKQTINAWYAKDLSFMYTASSNMVAKARLQIIVTSNSGITVYIDNIQWFVATAGPAPEPTPTPVNLLINGDFETGLTGWKTDAASAITLDTGSHGSAANPKNSAKLTNIAGKNAHLFAPNVSVVSGNTYQVSCDLKVVAMAGEIGFYIDEYDANGNWVSGKYLYTKANNVSGTVTFSYTPSSANVKTASLQIIMSSGAGTVAYLDNVQWL